MKTRTNQPVFKDNGELLNDSELGGTKLYRHQLEIYDDTYDFLMTNTFITNDPEPYSIDLTAKRVLPIGNPIIFDDNHSSLPFFLQLIEFQENKILITCIDPQDFTSVTYDLAKGEDTSVDDSVTAL